MFARNKFGILSLLAAGLGIATMSMAESTGGGATILDLDEMMDIEMDKVETLPDYVTPPAGAYMLSVSDCEIEKYKQKVRDNNGKDTGQTKDASRIRLTYTIDKTLESSDLPVKDGSLFSETFMGTEDGIKFFKKQAMNIMNVSDLSGARMKDVIDGLKGMSFKAKITIRKSPDGQGGSYENVQVRPVHEAAA
jgi:hypothetical protein